MIDILVVDDSLFSRSSVSHSLSGHGYRPILCANAEEALEKLKGLDSPRLVICDWVMEKLSGLDLCRAVRSALAFPYVYFILLTARTCKVDIAAAVNAGVDDCLTKPCGEVDLVARVNVGRRLLEQLEEIGRQHHHSQMLLAGALRRRLHRRAWQGSGRQSRLFRDVGIFLPCRHRGPQPRFQPRFPGRLQRPAL